MNISAGFHDSEIDRGQSIQVQSGGSFDVDYSVKGPSDNIVMENSKERQVDAVFTAKETGEYKFCFNNEMSTYTDKMVDFEIAVSTGYCWQSWGPSRAGVKADLTCLFFSRWREKVRQLICPPGKAHRLSKPLRSRNPS